MKEEEEREKEVQLFKTTPLYQKILSENTKITKEDWAEYIHTIENIYPNFTNKK
ncbi:MAG: hypothetical protein LBH58_05795 [Tannerellaceae bacterium]|jgi:uncharacterized membrane protein YcgQ (UPF0703/DUF1980 family)|nr:hypothetical protein [Tannerellaceae bacterium]